MRFLVDQMLGKLVKGLECWDTIRFTTGRQDPHQMIQLARQGRSGDPDPKYHTDPKKGRRIHPSSDRGCPFPPVERTHRKSSSRWTRRLFSRCLLCNAFLVEFREAKRKGRFRSSPSINRRSSSSVRNARESTGRLSPGEYAKKILKLKIMHPITINFQFTQFENKKVLVIWNRWD